MKTVGSIHLIPKRKKQFLFLEVENSFDGDVLIRKERCTAKRQRRLRMASDPDIAKKIENDITGIPAAHEQMFAKAKSDGIEIHGFAVRINADGSMQCSCSGSTRISGTKQSTSILNTEKRQKERVEKKREERKILEEKAAERRAERKEQMDKLTEDGEAESFAVSATGMDIKSVTQNLMATVSGTSAPIGAGFDIKA